MFGKVPFTVSLQGEGSLCLQFWSARQFSASRTLPAIRWEVVLLGLGHMFLHPEELARLGRRTGKSFDLDARFDGIVQQTWLAQPSPCLNRLACINCKAARRWIAVLLCVCAPWFFEAWRQQTYISACWTDM